VDAKFADVRVDFLQMPGGPARWSESIGIGEGARNEPIFGPEVGRGSCLNIQKTK